MMTPEERERLMEFILQSQAGSEIRLQRIEESHEKSVKRTDRLERLAKLFVGAGRRERRERRAVDEKVGIIISSHIDLTEQVDRLILVQAHNEEISQKNAEAAIELRASLAASQARQEESVAALNASLAASYEIKENLFFDLSLQYRTYKVDAAPALNNNSTMISAGIRWNAFKRRYDY